MALLAWTAFAVNAFAHPSMMAEASMAHASATTGTAASPHHSMTAMPMTDTARAAATPLQPAGHGQGCCTNAGCQCASSCVGAISVPRLVVAVAAPRALAFASVERVSPPQRITLLLRPPIA